MPSTYAHYCFGQAGICRRLPQEIQEEIKAYSPLLYDWITRTGYSLYYKPLKSNAINRIGYGMHGRPADEFLKAWMRARELPEGRGGFAYLYGFICHFALDHSCHPYIEKKIKESGVTHAEIEVEFDRMLLAKRDTIRLPTGLQAISQQI